MMPHKVLPYTGYSWPFTQHAIALDPKTLYGLLACASFHEGEKNPGRKITALMIKNHLLTPNVRSGRADAWRDYQQVLAELGLIYSTKIEQHLRLTTAGRMLLSGEIGFSELMTAQALRYQYPNGQKYDLIDLQVANGVNVKPATLIARVLIGLNERGSKPALSVEECLSFLLPMRNNLAWTEAVEGILKARANTEILRTNNRHARRNIQDWYKFLGKTDFFSNSGNELTISTYGQYAIAQLKSFCESQAKPEAFWLPRDATKASRLEWFDYFGEIPLNSQLMRTKEKADLKYEKANYIGGIDDDSEGESGEEGGHMSDSLISLTKISKEAHGHRRTVGPEPTAETALSNLRQGIMRRYAKTIMHDAIVVALAKHLEEQGAEVYEDRNSIDVLAIWPDGKETIFEVKTVTKKNFQHRLRLAVGQVEEYAYRRSQMVGTECDKAIVINSNLPEDSWYLDFLTKRMNIASVSRIKSSYTVFSPAICPTRAYWNL